MAKMTELERFEVRDDNGTRYTVIRYQEWSGGLPTCQRLLTLTGKECNADPEDPELFYLPLGFIDPWLSARRVDWGQSQ
ncbi:hypothetical protein ACIPIX_05110 [Pseudomonas protegens]|uniref:hypothetical protein n=1 Tax=Pseudomonas protegens TaxID=380021 RepID=UPI0038142FE1